MHGLAVVSPVDVGISGVRDLGHGIGANAGVFEISDMAAADSSSRHDAGANLNFADGHVAYFKYACICSNAVTKVADPGNPDINWTYNGQPVQ